MDIFVFIPGKKLLNEELICFIIVVDAGDLHFLIGRSETIVTSSGLPIIDSFGQL